MKKKALRTAPSGRLKIVTSKGHLQYYLVTPDKDVLPTYLSKKDLKLAAKLAQKAYDMKVIRAAEREIKAWNMLASFFPEQTVEEVYETLSPARQKLVTPVIETDEQYRARWEAVGFAPKAFREGAKVFYTDRGERVRSKSEQLIANLLYRLGIPYRYECPLEVVVNGRTRTWYPDFTILDVKNRREVYLEHLGMLDDTREENNYAVSAFYKMKVYEENGIYEGKNMIYSFETGAAPLDITYVEMKVRRMLGLPPLSQQVARSQGTSAGVRAKTAPAEVWEETWPDYDLYES